jgi:MazG family protein
MSNEFDQLIEVVKRLRDPETGCAWDLEQTHQSLVPFLIEETYEFKSAVETNNPEEMQDEIGDVLLQVLLHAQIASESNNFDIESVSKNLKEKLIRRHPHVFKNPEKKKFSPDEISANWLEIKEEEKKLNGNKSKVKTAIDSRVLNAPSLSASASIGKKTERINFDWEDASQVAWKVEEEWQELKEELMPSTINKERVAEELGDFLFSAAQLARHLDLDPEKVLHQANKKFLRRFHKMEAVMKDQSVEFGELKQEELDHYWRQAKMSEKQ